MCRGCLAYVQRTATVISADEQGMFILNALYFGQKVTANYALQIKNIVKAAREELGAVPVIFGECGVPMDLK